MRDIFPKFIIEDGALIISKVTYHKEIVIEKEKVQGGGWFRWNKEFTMCIFYGDSHDFGKARIEDIQKAVLDGKVYTNPYSEHSIANKFDFGYDTGTEIINLKTDEIPNN